ncbi:MAG: hypothetical protein KF833_03300 [Verrucomicrobiae bacterium]|nr:hypothetical protein [Verrucomicrobiae bacterium]
MSELALLYHDPAVATLGSLYVARRDLWTPLESLVRRHDLKLDDADVYLQLAHLKAVGPFARTRARAASEAGQDLTRVTAVSATRMRGLLQAFAERGLLHLGPTSRGRYAAPRTFEYTEKGERLMEDLWTEYAWLAGRVMVRASDADLADHARVCDQICRNTLALEYHDSGHPQGAGSRAEILHGILKSARGLLGPLGRMTLRGTELTVEKADILVLLYEHHLRHREGLTASGFMSTAHLRDSLVHSMAASSALLSRWLDDMGGRDASGAKPAGRGWVEFGEVKDGGRRTQARITPSGIEVIRRVWSEYVTFAGEVLAGLSGECLAAHRRVNRQISDLAAHLR